MMEKNRDIFKQALTDLPNHKADPKNWEALSASLDALDASRFIHTNKAGLPRHKAPAGAWNGIEQGLQASFWTGTTGLAIKIGSVVLFTATVITAVLFYNARENVPKPIETPVLESQQSEISAVPEQPVRSSGKGEEAFQASNKKQNSVGLEPVEDPKERIGNEYDEIRTASLPTLTSNSMGFPRKNSVSGSSLSEKPLPGMLSALNVKTLPIHPQLTYIPENYASGKSRIRNDYYQEKRRFDISLGAFYGWMYYNDVNPESMHVPDAVSSVGLDLFFEKDRFYIKTGLGFTSWEESADYEFRYNKNELVYEYLYVDSAAFVPGTNQITYFTTEQEVYDSVYYKKPDVVRNQYRVLQVPLIFGYKLVESRKWMIGMNVGLGADFNISSKIFKPLFSESESSLVGVENHMVYRPTINWRLMAGAGVFYRLSGRISFYLEPGFDVYLNALYPGTELQNASYYEVKFGILYKF